MISPLRRIERSAESLDGLTPDRRGLFKILWQLATTIEIRSVPPPAVADDLENLSSFFRIYICLRLFVLDLEFALSPNGHLRGLMRFLVRLMIIMGAVLLALAAILTLIAMVTALCVVISGHLAVIAINLLLALAASAGCLGAGFVMFMTVRWAMRCKAGNPGTQGYVPPSSNWVEPPRQ